MGHSRHLARVVVLQTLFALEEHGGSPDELLVHIAAEHPKESLDLTFTRKLLRGVIEHRDEIRNKITHFAPQWPIDKIAPADRAALEIGLYEMLECDDVPDVVAIDEAIELAKTFGNENSQKFVNGVLNAVLKQRVPPQVAPAA